jgi:hypothetical protein
MWRNGIRTKQVPILNVNKNKYFNKEEKRKKA